MPQTLLAFLAMLIVTLLSLNQQQALLRAYESILDDEMEVMGAGIGLQAMEHIMAQDFDANLFPTSLIDLEAQPFETGKGCTFSSVSPCTDVDDFHLMQPDTVDFDIRGAAMQFLVTAEVYYVDVDGDLSTPSASQTVNKEVVVVVQSVPLPDGRRLLRSPIRLRRIASCEVCATP
jgi:hypothetical protein